MPGPCNLFGLVFGVNPGLSRFLSLPGITEHIRIACIRDCFGGHQLKKCFQGVRRGLAVLKLRFGPSIENPCHTTSRHEAEIRTPIQPQAKSNGIRCPTPETLERRNFCLAPVFPIYWPRGEFQPPARPQFRSAWKQHRRRPPEKRGPPIVPSVAVMSRSSSPAPIHPSHTDI